MTFPIRPFTDTELLDWLEENADYRATACGESWWTVNGTTRAILRDAIEAAMGDEPVIDGQIVRPRHRARDINTAKGTARPEKEPEQNCEPGESR